MISNSVGKYYLGGKYNAAITPMEVEKQTLTDASVELVDDQTIMRFTKLLKEEGEIEIVAGDNTLLWAHGSSTFTTYHGENKSAFKLNILGDGFDDTTVTSSTKTAVTTFVPRTAAPFAPVSSNIVSSTTAVSITVGSSTTTPSTTAATSTTAQVVITKSPLSSSPTDSPSSKPITSVPTNVVYCPNPYDVSKTNYIAGDQVEVSNHAWECRAYPHDMYCNVAEFHPSLTEADPTAEELWLNAWAYVGLCYRTYAPTESHVSSKPTDAPTK